MPSPNRKQLDELGLEVADLFLLHRVILLVEGTHDQIVIEELIGDQLSDERVLVIPIRGGTNLASVVDAHVLANFSDAPVIAALDNLHADEINAFWDDLVLNAGGGQDALDPLVKRHFSHKRRAEESFIIDFCRAAVAAGTLGRFRVFGFSLPDIPMYLPVDVLVPGAGSWTQLYGEFEAQKKHKSFKPWLRDKYGIEIDETLLRSGLAAMDQIPTEFTDLIELARELRTNGR